MDSDEKVNEGISIIPYIKRYFVRSSYVLFIWTLGYYNWSPSWLLVGTFFYLFNNEFYRKLNIARIIFARESNENECKAILARTGELPAWVYFPDVEKAEWLNKMIKQMWPYIGDYVRNLLKTSIGPSISNSMPSSLKPFRFEEIDLGDIPPRICGVKVYIENTQKDEILLDLDLSFSSDSEIKVGVRGIAAGIKNLTIKGRVRVVIRPLCGQIPFIGGLNIFCINPPTVDFDLTNTAKLFDVPLLNQTLRHIISDQIAYFLVLPNKIPVQLIKNINRLEFKFPSPQGVLRVHIIEGRDLKASDINLSNIKKSNAFVRLYIGSHNFKTKVLESLNPNWNEFFEGVVDQTHGHYAEFEVLDKDICDDDDELGEATLDITNIMEHGSIDTWLHLENVEKGMIHINASWLYLSKSLSDLQKTVDSNKRTQKKYNYYDSLASALLSVTLHSAKNIARSRSTFGVPSPYAKLMVGNTEFKSVTRPRTTEPKWEQNFQFFIIDPSHEELKVEVLDSANKDKELGHVIIPISNVIKAHNMTMGRFFTLTASVANTQIYLILRARILTSLKPLAPEDPIMKISSSVDEDGIQIANKESETLPSVICEPVTSVLNAALNLQHDDGIDKIHVCSAALHSEPSHSDSYHSEPMNIDPPQDARHRKVPGEEIKDQADLGQIQITICYSHHSGSLFVVIHKCMNLISCDDNKLSDPYVKIYLLPDKSKDSKRKTEVVKDNLFPIFNEKFEWVVPFVELPTKTLQLTVKNDVNFFSHNRTNMGVVLIDFAHFDFSEAITSWYSLIEDEKDK